MGILKPKKEVVKHRQVKRYSKDRVFVFIICVLVGVVWIVNFLSSQALRERVDILVFSENIPQEGAILEQYMKKESMMLVEYEKYGTLDLGDGSKRRSIVLWDDRDVLIGTYASHYIRKETPVYWDSLTREVPKRHAYLYKMDGELLKIDLKADQFGEMLLVGDKINVRVTYMDTIYKLPTPEEFEMAQTMGLPMEQQVERQKMLFNNATVLDVLNGEGESVFDLYYKLLSMSKREQQVALADEAYKERLAPQTILLNTTPEEVDAYAKIMNKSPRFVWTLLPRSGGNTLLDALSELNLGFTREKGGE